MSYDRITDHASMGDLDKVKQCVALQGKSIINTERDRYERTALMLSSTHGRPAVVKYLVENGARLDDNSDFGTALILGAGRPEIAIYLIEQGACVNAANEKGETALMIASDYGHLAVVTALVEKGADVNATMSESNGRTALGRAVSHNHLEVVNYLLGKGANVDDPVDGQQGTALTKSTRHGLAMVKTLVEHGANVNHANNNGFTPLSYAAETPRIPGVVEFLIERGANVNRRDEQGWTALLRASNCNVPSHVQLLVKSGADVNLGSNNGRTPLKCASEEGDVATVLLLLEHGANPDA